MLGGVGATNLDVELVATVTTADDNGAANEPTERFKHFLAELLQYGGKETLGEESGRENYRDEKGDCEKFDKR